MLSSRLNQSLLFQLHERRAQIINADPEVIGNDRASPCFVNQRRISAFLRVLLRYRDQEGRKSHEQIRARGVDEEIAPVCKFATDGAVKSASRALIVRRKRMQIIKSETAHLGIDRGAGIGRVTLQKTHSDKIACQSEFDNIRFRILIDRVDAERAGLDPIEVRFKVARFKQDFVALKKTKIRVQNRPVGLVRTPQRSDIVAYEAQYTHLERWRHNPDWPDQSS